MTAADKVLVAGVGNIFLGDDGWGVEVVHRLSTMDIPAGVRVADYGIRGMHLAYDLAGADYDLTLIVDAAARGEPPGTVSLVDLDVPQRAEASLLDAHGMQPDVVLGLVAELGADPGRVVLVCCEPATLDHGMSLSAAVEQAVDPAVALILDLIGRAPFATEEELACALASLAK